MLFCKMEPFGLLLFLILTGFSSALNQSLITVSSFSSAGVVLLTGPRGQYQFNFTEASEACLFKNLSIATKPQLQKAWDSGLEACSFGWLSEQMAVVPRLTSVYQCGSGLVGLVTWRASRSKRFGVWCFNSSDPKEVVKAAFPTSPIPTTSAKTTLQTTTFATTSILTTITTRTTTTFPKTLKMTNPTGTILYVSSPLAPWIHSTVKPQTSAASETVSTQFSTITTNSLLGLIHSSLTESTPTFDPYNEPTSRSYEAAITSVSTKTTSQRVLLTSLVVVCAIVLILLTGGAFFFYKICKRCVWPRVTQKEDDTEMWRQTSSELELQKDREDERREREEKRFTISSETMLHTTDPQ